MAMIMVVAHDDDVDDDIDARWRVSDDVDVEVVALRCTTMMTTMMVNAC